MSNAIILLDFKLFFKLRLKRINEYGWFFVTRVPRTRRFNGQQIKKTHRGGYWTRVGNLKSLRVKSVRRKGFADTIYRLRRKLTLPQAPKSKEF